ncbi:MAG: hypothetical protein JXR05_07940 [Flavobacteriaceae bacterium]
MKKLLYLISVLLIYSSCKKNQNYSHQKLEAVTYNSIGYRLKSDFYDNTNKENRDKYIDRLLEAKPLMNFKNNDTLILNKNFGLQFFNDTIFKYQIKSGKIILNHPSKNITINYTSKNSSSSEWLDISFENKIFESISLKKGRIIVQDKTRDLYGTYIGYRVELTDNSKYKNLDSIGRPVFKFMDNQVLKMSPKFGMTYFGDSIFNYLLKENNLILENYSSRYKYKIPFTGTDLRRSLKMNINNKDFTFIWFTRGKGQVYESIDESKIISSTPSIFRFAIGNSGIKYGIYGFTIGDKYEDNPSDGFKKIKKYFNSDYYFNFKKNGIVKLDSLFGNKFFGGTEFKYEVVGDFIRFKSKDTTHELNYYMDHTILNLELNHSELRIIQMSDITIH